MYESYIKRLLDFTIALVALLFFSPVFICIILLLFYFNRGKVFFLQQRPGMNEKPFHVIKFKSMTDARDKEGKLLPDNKRITKFGTFIRKFSLDELPQLLNVLIGDMSLVGPRPLLFKYIPLYNEQQRKRHLVKPGITGWAQINGRNAISWTEKFNLDIYYKENISFLLDLKILFLTVFKVLKRDGVNQSEERPMMPFNGNN